jgi:hypothetical protein
MQEARMISQHKQQIRFSTVAAVVFMGVVSLAVVAMVGATTYFFAIGKEITLSQWLVAMALGLFLGGGTGICFVRVFRRMFSVREIRLFENDTIEIVTWRGKIFMARLPENIKHMLVIGTNYSVTFQVEDRWFVVDSEQFSDRERINDFFRRFVERCSTKIG